MIAKTLKTNYIKYNLIFRRSTYYLKHFITKFDIPLFPL